MNKKTLFFLILSVFLISCFNKTWEKEDTSSFSIEVNWNNKKVIPKETESILVNLHHIEKNINISKILPKGQTSAEFNELTLGTYLLNVIAYDLEGDSFASASKTIQINAGDNTSSIELTETYSSGILTSSGIMINDFLVYTDDLDTEIKYKKYEVSPLEDNNFSQVFDAIKLYVNPTTDSYISLNFNLDISDENYFYIIADYDETAKKWNINYDSFSYKESNLYNSREVNISQKFIFSVYKANIKTVYTYLNAYYSNNKDIWNYKNLSTIYRLGYFLEKLTYLTGIFTEEELSNIKDLKTLYFDKYENIQAGIDALFTNVENYIINLRTETYNNLYSVDSLGLEETEAEKLRTEYNTLLTNLNTYEASIYSIRSKIYYEYDEALEEIAALEEALSSIKVNSILSLSFPIFLKK